LDNEGELKYNNPENPLLSATDDLDIYNESIEDGDNVWEDINYNFSGNVLDPDDNYGTKYQSGKLQTQFTQTGFDTIYNDTVDVGNYVGTYSFTDDPISESGDYYGGNSDVYSFVGETGETGTDIEYVDNSHEDSNEEIIASLGGHYEVLNHTVDVNWMFFQNYFDSIQTSGTIEWWLRVEDAYKRTYQRLYDGSNNKIIEVGIVNDHIFYRDVGADTRTECDPASDNTWYHFKLYFYDTGSTFFSLWVNGCLQVEDQQATGNFTDGIERILWGLQDDTYVAFYDAIGYSFDVTYTIGDNCNPYGLPTEVSGFIGSNTIHPYTSVSVIANLDGHKKVLNLTDDSTYGRINLFSDVFTEQTSGTVEFWIRTTDTTPYSVTYIQDGSSAKAILLIIQSNKFRYYDGSYHDICAINNDQWYQVEIEFDCATDWHLWVDSVSQDGGTGYSYNGNPTAMDRMQFVTLESGSDWSIFYDAFGFSWEDHNIGDNLKMHISAERSFNFRGIWKYRFNLYSYGTNYLTDWIYFEVVEQGVNFEAVSESQYTTQWVLMTNETAGSYEEKYHDPLDSGFWDLVTNDGDREIVFTESMARPTDDSYVRGDNPNTNYDYVHFLYVDEAAPEWSYIKKEHSYLTSNVTANSMLDIDKRNYGGSGVVYFYKTGDFEEETITWNNKPSLGTYLTSYNFPDPIDRYEVNLGSYAGCYLALTPYGTVDEMRFGTHEGSAPAFIFHYLSKQYYGDGLMYMQTDETETLGLVSQTFSDVELLANSYFVVQLKTSTSNQIKLQLFNDGVLQKELVVIVSGNVNYENQTVEVLVDDDVTFDQLKFIGILQSTQHFIVYDVKANGYSEESSENIFSIYVDPDGYKQICLNPNIYNLKIYERDVLKVEKSIQITHELYTEIYKTIGTVECRLTFFSQFGMVLDFGQFYVNITRTYFNETTTFWLLSEIFLADIDTSVYFKIYDRFGISIKNDSFVANEGGNYFSITLTLYSLKIYNQQEMFNWINITRDPNYYDSEDYWSEWLAPNEISDYRLFEGYYKINVTSNEYGSSSVYSYTLNGDDILLITSDNTITNTIINLQNVNTTLGNQITNVEINITNQNTAINQSIINVDINLSNVNSSIGDLLLSQNIQLTNIQNNISTLFVYLNNNFTTLGNNINTSFIELNSSIFLVNNSIYTAINVLEANLFMINNSISGNISIILLQNDFLTAIYNKTMFSDLLNWTDVGYNFSIMEDRIDLFNFINNYRNQSVEVLLKYKDKIDSMIVSAQFNLEQWLPKQDVEYRLKSIATGEYLNEWEPLPENKTVDFGFYETEIDPGPLMANFMTIFWSCMGLLVVIVNLIILYAKLQQQNKRIPKPVKERYKKKPSNKSSKREIYTGNKYGHEKD